MPNQITANGLETKTYADVVSDLTTDFQTIYGPDVNLASNTPDGQVIGNFAQQIVDELDLNAQTYSSFDPDQAVGTTLDARVALNGIRRQGGTYSTTDISVTTSGACNLKGLDGNDAPVGGEFIVQDNSGVQWVLVNDYSFGATPTTIPLVFRAVNIGAVLSTPNTITTPVTIVIGVLTVNNPTTQLSTGANQESDAALKLRRQKSVALSSSGFYDALEAALLNISGVTTAQVYENETDSTDGDNIPAHSIWVVIAGGTNAEIAQAIYSKRNAGCGMKGDVSFVVTRNNGSPFTIYWDEVSSERMYFKFTLDALSGNLSTTANIPAAGGAVLSSVASTTGMSVGNVIRGTGIPANTYITAIGSGTITISRVTTGAGSTGATITVVPLIANPAVSGSITNTISSSLSPLVNEEININQMATLIQSINPNALVSFVAGVSGLSKDNSTYTYTLTPTTKAKQFSLVATDIFVL